MFVNRFIYIFLVATLALQGKDFTIMLDPAGDAQHTGRIINNTFERGVSLECAKVLKEKITAACPEIRVILTRVPGETLQPLQNASFANRLDIDLYLGLYFYKEEEAIQQLSLYYYLANKTTDFWYKAEPLFFYPAHQAYLLNLHKTKKLGEQLLSVFQSPNSLPFFHVAGLVGIPFKPLIGITAPALSLEIGLQNSTDWNYIIEPIIIFIKQIQNDR
jgi:hypothetical protein